MREESKHIMMGRFIERTDLVTNRFESKRNLYQSWVKVLKNWIDSQLIMKP